MYEYEVQEIQSPPGYGCSEETFSIVFDREKEAVIQLYELSITNKKTRAQFSKLDMATGEELPGASLELKRWMERSSIPGYQEKLRILWMER